MKFDLQSWKRFEENVLKGRIRLLLTFVHLTSSLGIQETLRHVYTWKERTEHADYSASNENVTFPTK